jgi:hypothetical protein
MRLLRILKNSNIKLSVDLNPFCWSFVYLTDRIETSKMIYIRVLPFSLVLVLDNGL